jgi:hypothetical protein
MGDEELNFTEEEAREWAADPRNQAPRGSGLIGIVIACILVIVGFIASLLVGSTSNHSPPMPAKSTSERGLYSKRLNRRAWIAPRAPSGGAPIRPRARVGSVTPPLLCNLHYGSSDLVTSAD